MQQQPEKKSKSVKKKLFQKVENRDRGDILKFLVIAIYMGLVRKPRIHDYLSTNRVMTNTFPLTCFKRDRFKTTLAFLQLKDNRNYIPTGR